LLITAQRLRSARCGGSSTGAESRVKRKNTAHATGQDCAGVLDAVEEWFDGQLELDPEKLILIDDTKASTDVAHRYGIAPRGRRCLLRGGADK
jgi:hypothetical protein